MRIYEIKKIGPGPVFKLNFVVGLVFGLILGMLWVFTGGLFETIGYNFGWAHNVTNGGLVHGVIITLSIIVIGLIYGLIYGLLGLIGTFIYNVLARLIGGVTVQLSEKE